MAVISVLSRLKTSDHVIFWPQLRRLGQTHDAPFENVKLKGILHDLHERQECLRRQSDAAIQVWTLST